MTSTPTLPYELWENILDLAIHISVTPREQCDHLTFPYIIEDLLSEKNKGSIDPTYDSLRRVCRLFRALMGPSPRFVMTDGEKRPSRKTKALYIRDDITSTKWIGMLAAEQVEYHYLVTLDIFCYVNRHYSQPVSFDALCKVAHVIPNVQTLTFRLEKEAGAYYQRNVWSLINSAFPELTSLVLLAKNGLFMLPPNELATFKLLTILHIGFLVPYGGFRAPCLRHLSLAHRLVSSNMGILQHFPHLESLFVRRVDTNEAINVSMFPHLRLFGFPASMMLTPELIGSDCCPNLTHLWIHPSAYPCAGQLTPLHHIPTIISTICRVTYDLSSLQRRGRNMLISHLETSGCVRRGIFTLRREMNEVMLIILERSAVTV